MQLFRLIPRGDVKPLAKARRALELSASAVILVHNTPRALRISIHDHLVVGRDGVASYRALGRF